jgi:hypothetical protein
LYAVVEGPAKVLEVQIGQELLRQRQDGLAQGGDAARPALRDQHQPYMQIQRLKTIESEKNAGKGKKIIRA